MFMTSRLFSVAPRGLSASTALALVAACALWPAPLGAAGPAERPDTSLNFVPADAAFYSALLANAEQIEALVNSRAVKAVLGLPAVREAIDRFNSEMLSGQYATQVKAVLENPEVRNVLAMLGDMVSHEVFVYGDPGTVDLIELIQRVSNSVQFKQTIGQLTGEATAVDHPEALVLAALADNIDLVKTPNVIVGFRVKNRPLAVEELAKLEATINLLLMFQPAVSGCWKRTTIEGSDFLVLSLDGNMIPWEQVPLDEARENELREGDVDKVIGRIKSLKTTVALGLRGDYLLLAFGPSTERLAQLGKGKSLADRPEFQPLSQYANRRLVSIGYASQAALSRLAYSTRDVRELLKAVGEALPQFGLSSDQQDEIRKDIGDLRADLKAAEPNVRAMAAFRFLGERGIEGYSRTWGDFPHLDAGKALSLLEHVGGKPILAVLGRSRGSEAQYDVAVKWVKRAYHYLQEFAVPLLPPDEREDYDEAVKLFEPLAKRWDNANRLMIRAMADGQCGLVLDAKLQSRQFHKDLPATERPMPMIEPALIFGVSDAKLLRQAAVEYGTIFQDTLEAIRKIVPDPDEVPRLSVKMKLTQTESGTLYTFELPETWRLSKEIAMSLGLSDRVAVAAINEDHAKRLLTPTPPRLGGVLEDAKRPRAMAVAVDWAGLIAAATPWVELGVSQALGEEPVKETPPPNPAPANPPAAKDQPRQASVLDQVRVALKALAAIPAITGETYEEAGALVTHTLVEVRDTK